MLIKINGQEKRIESGLDLQTLLQIEGFADKKIATALNGTFVPRAAYDVTLLKDGDALEIVAPMQGG